MSGSEQVPSETLITGHHVAVRRYTENEEPILWNERA
jgi:hypothetical protein